MTERKAFPQSLSVCLLLTSLLLGACAAPDAELANSQPDSSQLSSDDSPPLSTQATLALPAGGQDVLGADTFSALNGSSSSAVKIEPLVVARQTFTQGWRITGIGPSVEPYETQFSAPSLVPIKKGDVLVLQFWARALNNKPAQTEFVFEDSETYEKSLTAGVALTPNWTLYSVPFRAVVDYAAGRGVAHFRLGYNNQSFKLGGVVLKTYGGEYPVSALPSAGFSYPGREAGASWRAAAATRIEQLRKGDVTVRVQDAGGKAVPNAAVKLEMQRHAFGFGSAVSAGKLFENTADSQKYQELIPTLFNRVVLENDLKWPDWETYSRDQALKAIDFFRAKGIQVRGHNLIWPCDNDYCLPKDVPGLFGNPVALKERIDKHLVDILGATKGKIVEWDVINEPSANKELAKVLGEDEMAAQLRRAKQLEPNARMFINDYGNLGEGTLDTEYKRILRRMQALKAPLEGIGLQAHFGYKLTPPEELNTRLNDFGALGLPLTITEFDVNMTNEQLQADYLRDFMTVAFANKNVDSFLMWGFWEGNHWLPNAALYRQNWSIKPSGQAFKNLVFGKWWTRASGQSSAAGSYSTRGFYGEYKLSVTVGGRTKTQTITLKKGMGEVTVKF